MRIEHGYRPGNRWLERPLDERWRRWLIGCVAGAAVVGVSMGAFVGPRQAVMRMRYEIAQLTEEVDRLEREQRRLRLEREALTSPETLSRQVGELGLEFTPRARVAHLTADGRILFAPLPPASVPAAAGRKAPAAGGKEPTLPSPVAMNTETRAGGEGAGVRVGTPRGDLSERPALPARAGGVRGGEGAGVRAGGDRPPRGE